MYYLMRSCLHGVLDGGLFRMVTMLTSQVVWVDGSIKQKFVT